MQSQQDEDYEKKREREVSYAELDEESCTVRGDRFHAVQRVERGQEGGQWKQTTVLVKVEAR